MPQPIVPNAIKRLRGNPGRRPLAEDVDAGTLKRLPEPPDYLSADGRKFYRLAVQ